MSWRKFIAAVSIVSGCSLPTALHSARLASVCLSLPGFDVDQVPAALRLVLVGGQVRELLDKFWRGSFAAAIARYTRMQMELSQPSCVRLALYRQRRLAHQRLRKICLARSSRRDGDPHRSTSPMRPQAVWASRPCCELTASYLNLKTSLAPRLYPEMNLGQNDRCKRREPGREEWASVHSAITRTA